LPSTNTIQIKKNEMAKACGTYRGEDNCIQVLLVNPEGSRLLGRIRLGGRTILKWI